MTASKTEAIHEVEILTGIADEVGRNYDAERENLLAQFLPTLSQEQRSLYNRLDDLAIAELCDVQSRTAEEVQAGRIATSKAAAC